MTVTVVVIHAFRWDNLIGGDNPFINYFVFFPSVDFGRIAVPLFFVISGFLFFKDDSPFTLDVYKSKIIKRIRTLLIPYVLFSAFMIFIIWFSYRDFVPEYLRIGTLLPDYSVGSIIVAWLVKPQAFYLWFLRNLFVLCLCSPVLYWLIKKGGWLFMGGVLIVWLFFQAALPSATLSAVFFCMGAFVAIKGVKLPERVHIGYFIHILVLWLCFVFLSKQSIALPASMSFLFISAHTLLGVIGVWMLYDYLSDKTVDRFIDSTLATYLFCVYLFHAMFLDVFDNIAFYLLGSQTNSNIILVYYLSIPVSIALSVLLAFILKRFLPPVYKLLTGSR